MTPAEVLAIIEDALLDADDPWHEGSVPVHTQAEAVLDALRPILPMENA